MNIVLVYQFFLFSPFGKIINLGFEIAIKVRLACVSFGVFAINVFTNMSLDISQTHVIAPRTLFAFAAQMNGYCF